MVKNNIKEKEIIEHLRNWIKKQEIFKNKGEIAKYLSVSYSHFNNILRGDRQASSEVINKIIIMTDFKKVNNVKSKNESSHEDRPYREFGMELRKWFNKQSRWRRQRDLTDFIGIDNSTFSKYCTGKSFPKGEIRKKLFEITGMESLNKNGTTKKKYVKNISEDDEVSHNKTPDDIGTIINNIIKEFENLKSSLNQNKKLLSYSKKNEPSYLKFANAFYQLAEEIALFRGSGIKEREKLRNLISAKDVGYVSSFLKALFDEDKFSDFILFSKYEFEMGGKNE